MAETGANVHNMPKFKAALEGTNGIETEAAAPPSGTITLDPLREAIEDGIDLVVKAKVASDRIDDWVKAIAKKTGLTVPNVRKFLKARAGDRYFERKAAANQLSMVFDEVGDE